MKMSSSCAVTTFVLLMTLALLTSARPRFDLRKLRMKRDTLEERSLTLPVNNADRKGSQTEDNVDQLLGLKDFDTSPVDTEATAVPNLGESDHAQSDASTNKSHQGKIRVRRRCFPTTTWGCPRPTSPTLRHKHAHHRHVHRRRHMRKGGQ